MNRFSKTQIYLHWITLLFVAITYAAMELRGWFPKGSSCRFNWSTQQLCENMGLRRFFE